MTVCLALGLAFWPVSDGKASFPGGTGKEAAAWIYGLTKEPVMVNTFGAVPAFSIDLTQERKPDESQSAFVGRLITSQLKREGVVFDTVYSPDISAFGIRIGRPQSCYPRVTRDLNFWRDFALGYPATDQSQVLIEDGRLRLASGNYGSAIVASAIGFFSTTDHWVSKDGTVAIAGIDIARAEFREMRKMCSPLEFNESGDFVVSRKRATRWMLEGALRKTRSQRLASWFIEGKEAVYSELLNSLSDQEFNEIFRAKSDSGPVIEKEFAPLSATHQVAMATHNRARKEGPYEGDNSFYLEMVRDTPQLGDADPTKPVKVVLAVDGQLAFIITTTTGNQQVW